MGKKPYFSVLFIVVRLFSFNRHWSCFHWKWFHLPHQVWHRQQDFDGLDSESWYETDLACIQTWTHLLSITNRSLSLCQTSSCFRLLGLSSYSPTYRNAHRRQINLIFFVHLCCWIKQIHWIIWLCLAEIQSASTKNQTVGVFPISLSSFWTSVLLHSAAHRERHELLERESEIFRGRKRVFLVWEESRTAVWGGD